MMLGLNRRILKVCGATALLCFFMAAGAVADDRRGNASRDRGQLAVVEEVDTVNRTLKTGGTTYSVPQQADLEDEAGNRITLGQIRGVGSRASADLVEIWTRQNGRNGQPEIRRLRVKPAMSF